MRVGFVTRLLWDRYGPFWLRLLASVEAETVLPDPEQVARHADDPRLEVVSGRAFRDAAAEAVALAGCDRIVVPHLNPGYDGSRGSAQDPFVADFPGALAQVVPGLPGLLPVPAELAREAIEGRAVEVLTTVAPSAAQVPRAWQTHRADARPPRTPAIVDGRAGADRTVGLVGQPWHLDPDTVRRAGARAEHVIAASHFSPAELREEGWRIDPKLAPSDAEALGAARRLGRRPGVDRVRMIVDRTSGADAWLERRIREHVRQPFETVDLSDVAPPLEPRSSGPLAGGSGDG